MYKKAIIFFYDEKAIKNEYSSNIFYALTANSLSGCNLLLGSVPNIYLARTSINFFAHTINTKHFFPALHQHTIFHFRLQKRNILVFRNIFVDGFPISVNDKKVTMIKVLSMDFASSSIWCNFSMIGFTFRCTRLWSKQMKQCTVESIRTESLVTFHSFSHFPTR